MENIMKKFMVLALIFVLGSVSVFAEGEPEYMWCNIGIDQVGGEQCIALNLPNNRVNSRFCERLDGDASPNGGTFATSWTSEAVCGDVTPVPTFTTIGAGLALIGSIGAYLKLKKSN